MATMSCATPTAKAVSAIYDGSFPPVVYAFNSQKTWRCQPPEVRHASHGVEYGHATPEWELRGNLGLLCGNYKKTGG
jgi:hypothetical protein